MPLSFRSRLTVWYIAVLATLLAGAATLIILILQGMAERRLDATLWVLGATEAEGVVARLRDRGLRAPDDATVSDIDYRMLPGYGAFRIQKYVTVVNREGRVVDFSINLPKPLPISDELVRRAMRGEIGYQTADVLDVGRLRMIYIPVLRPQFEPFVIIVAVPTEFVGAEIGTLSRRIAAIIIAVLVLAGVSGLLLARRALRPISEISLAVQRLTERNLHERLPEPRTGDEIDELVKVFNQLLARLDHAFDAQRRFTADASHELCTPLTVLKGETEVALLERRTPEEYEALLRSNLEEIERLSRLAANLLLLARSDAGEQQIVKDLIVLNDLIAEACARLSPLAKEREIEVYVNAPQLILLEGDRLALEHVIMNLLSNALRYTPRGGQVSIEAALTADGFARLDVCDTGIGIPPEALPHIFERFYRADNARAHEPQGSGLGLAICQAIAKAHGGRIEVESELGKGSRFTLFIPLAPALHSAQTHEEKGCASVCAAQEERIAESPTRRWIKVFSSLLHL